MTAYRYADVEGLRVFYREAGDAGAPAVLLLHGFPTSSHMYRDLIGPLAARYRVVAPDLPGFGFTDAPDRSSFAYSFDNLARVIDRFSEVVGLTRYALYIFDYGAPVGLRLALAHPERITALISQNGNAYEEGLSSGWNPIQRYWQQPSEVNRRALRDFLTPEATRSQYTYGVADPSLIAPESFTLDSVLLDRPGNVEIQLDLFLDYRNNVALYPEFQRYFREHRPPTLAVWGKNDPFFLPAGAEAYRRDNPEAEVHFFETGHFALETHLHEIAGRIHDFLDRALDGSREDHFAEWIAPGISEAATQSLARLCEQFGFVPNLALALAAEPAALDGYVQALQAFGQTHLSPLEQQIVMIAASRANAALYSVAVHATVASQLGATESTVVAARDGKLVDDARLAVLQHFAEALMLGRGQVNASQIEQMRQAGYNAAALVAVAFGVAVKFFANSVVHLARPPIDDGFKVALVGWCNQGHPGQWGDSDPCDGRQRF